MQQRYRPFGRVNGNEADHGDPFAPGTFREPTRAPVRPSYKKLPPSELLLALDIETVADREILPQDFEEAKFPKPIQHRVVAISVVEAKVERDGFDAPETYRITECRSGGDPSWDEQLLLRSFWTYFAEKTPRVATWNGRSFDMAVLRQRSMIYGIATDWWSQCGDKWSSYSSRFEPAWHADVMDVLADFGASPRLSLGEFAAAIGLPGKIENGSDVAAMVAAGEIERVRNYCEVDAAITFLAYLRFALATGRSSPEGYNASVESVVEYLESQSDRPHLTAFLAEWRASTRPAAMKVPLPRPVRAAA